MCEIHPHTAYFMNNFFDATQMLMNLDLYYFFYNSTHVNILLYF